LIEHHARELVLRQPPRGDIAQREDRLLGIARRAERLYVDLAPERGPVAAAQQDWLNALYDAVATA